MTDTCPHIAIHHYLNNDGSVPAGITIHRTTGGNAYAMMLGMRKLMTDEESVALSANSRSPTDWASQKVLRERFETKVRSLTESGRSFEDIKVTSLTHPSAYGEMTQPVWLKKPLVLWAHGEDDYRNPRLGSLKTGAPNEDAEVRRTQNLVASVLRGDFTRAQTSGLHSGSSFQADPHVITIESLQALYHSVRKLTAPGEPLDAYELYCCPTQEGQAFLERRFVQLSTGV